MENKFEEILEQMQWEKDFRSGGIYYANKKAFERQYEKTI